MNYETPAVTAPNAPDSSLIAYYLRLAAVFRDRIASGEWQPGMQLPTIPELCERYGAARNTVRQALQLLVLDGLLSSTRGRGTFVADHAQPLRAAPDVPRTGIDSIMEAGAQDTATLLKRESGIRLPQELMQPGEGNPDSMPGYVRILKMYTQHGAPFNLADIYVSSDVYARLPPEADRGSKISQLIQEHAGAKVARNRQEITVARADAEVAALFRCPVGDVLIRIRRWRTDDRGELIFAGVNLYRGDRFVLNLIDEDPSDLNYRPGLVPSDLPDTQP